MTGYNIHEDSTILAERRVEMIRRAKVRALWRRAAFLIEAIEAGRRAA